MYNSKPRSSLGRIWSVPLLGPNNLRHKPYGYTWSLAVAARDTTVSLDLRYHAIKEMVSRRKGVARKRRFDENNSPLYPKKYIRRYGRMQNAARSRGNRSALQIRLRILAQSVKKDSGEEKLSTFYLDLRASREAVLCALPASVKRCVVSRHRRTFLISLRSRKLFPPVRYKKTVFIFLRNINRANNFLEKKYPRWNNLSEERSVCDKTLVVLIWREWLNRS